MLPKRKGTGKAREEREEAKEGNNLSLHPA
jgi:hypothetical protein